MASIKTRRVRKKCEKNPEPRPREFITGTTLVRFLSSLPHPPARAASTIVKSTTAYEKYSNFCHERASRRFKNLQYFCAGLALMYDVGSMANFSHLGTYARLEKLS